MLGEAEDDGYGYRVDDGWRLPRRPTQREAFDYMLTTADLAETLGFDSIWLAERHFSPPGGAALVSSIGSAPLLVATAIATRTSRLRIGTAVLLLPLGHPVRLAEEVATLDHLSHGRLSSGSVGAASPEPMMAITFPMRKVEPGSGNTWTSCD